ncbi:MAG: hypothetical protein ACREX3_00085 [Gammaproteobacteria bacterium]
MTDADRALLEALTDACDKFCLNLMGSRPSHRDQIEIVLMFLHLADRMLRRIVAKTADEEASTL